MLIRRNNDYVEYHLMDTRGKQKYAGAIKKIGIKRMVMLTGDNQKVADAVAKEIGLTDAWAACCQRK